MKEIKIDLIPPNWEIRGDNEMGGVLLVAMYKAAMIPRKYRTATMIL